MSLRTKQIYEFGQFRLDATERLLFQNGVPLPLPPKVLDTLVVLVEENGRLIGKEELMKRVWPDTFVEENNLNKNVSALRKALGQGQDDQKFIETVPKRGYRFIAEVRQADNVETELVIERSKARILIEEETDAPEVEARLEQPPLEEARRASALTVGSRAASVAWWKRRPLVLTSAVVLCVLLTAAIAGVLIWKRPNPQSNSAPPRTIAVLPFAPIRAEGRDEFLELGMADALITKLSNLKQVIVRPTSSVRKYLGLNQDPLEAGRELKVGAVLVGNVQKIGDTLRVTVQLINVEDGRPLWAEKFDTKFTDIFAVQDAISGKVVGALALKLSGDENQRLAKRYTQDSQAYEFYQKGRYFLGNRSEENVYKAIEYFKQAIERDPSYALAYSGLADAHYMLVRFSYAGVKQEYNLTKGAATKAIELDNSLAEAYTSLALIEFYYDWDWQSAERDFQRAIELNPNYTTEHMYYGYYLLAAGRTEEGVREGERAYEIDPVSLEVNSDLAVIYIGARQFDKGIERARKTIELDPNYFSAHVALGRGYLLAGRYQESVEQYEIAYRTDKTFKIGLAQAYAKVGRRADALKILDEMNEESKRRYISFDEMALIYTALGDKDKAFEYLDKALADHDFRILFLKPEARFDSLHSDPRWPDLLRRAGLTE